MINSRQSANYRRSAFTIIEVITVLVLALALLGGTVRLMSLAGRSHQQSRNNLIQRQGIRRFADDLRRDVRNSDDRKVEDGKLVLTNSASGLEVSYRPESQTTIIRSVQTTDNQVESSDQYIVGSDAKMEFSWLDEIDAVECTITEAGKESHPIKVTAARRAAR